MEIAGALVSPLGSAPRLLNRRRGPAIVFFTKIVFGSQGPHTGYTMCNFGSVADRQAMLSSLEGPKVYDYILLVVRSN